MATDAIEVRLHATTAPTHGKSWPGYVRLAGLACLAVMAAFIGGEVLNGHVEAPPLAASLDSVLDVTRIVGLDAREVLFRPIGDETVRYGYSIAIMYFCIGATVVAGLLHQSRLVPAWLARFDVVASLVALFLGIGNVPVPALTWGSGIAVTVPIFVAGMVTGLRLLYHSMANSPGSGT